MDKIEIVITRGCDAEGDGGTVVENAGALLGDVVGNGIGVSDAGTTRALALFTSGSSGSGSFLYHEAAWHYTLGPNGISLTKLKEEWDVQSDTK